MLLVLPHGQSTLNICFHNPGQLKTSIEIITLHMYIRFQKLLTAMSLKSVVCFERHLFSHRFCDSPTRGDTGGTSHYPFQEASEFVSEDSSPEVERSDAECLRRTHGFNALHVLLPLLKKN